VQRDPNTATLIYFLDKLNGSLIQHYIDAKKYSFGELFNLEIRYGCSFDVTKSEYDEHAVPYCEFMPHLTCPAFEVYVDAGHLAIEKFPTITRQQRLLLSAPEVLDALEKSKFSMDWFYSLEKEIIAVCEAQQPPAKSEDMIALLSAGKFTSQHMKVLHKNGTLAHFTPWNTKLLIDNVLSLDDVVNQTEICQRFNQEWVTNYLKYYRNYLSIDDVLNETATYQRFGQQWVQDLNLEPNDVKDEAIFERFNQPWVCEFYHTNWLSRDDIRAKTFAFKNLTQAWVRELIQERQITPKSPLGQLLRYNVDRAMIQTQYEAQRFFANAGAKIQSFFEHGQ
jgi:hypothetical protein